MGWSVAWWWGKWQRWRAWPAGLASPHKRTSILKGTDSRNFWPRFFRILSNWGHYSYAKLFSFIVSILQRHLLCAKNLLGVIDTAESSSAMSLTPQSQTPRGGGVTPKVKKRLYLVFKCFFSNLKRQIKQISNKYILTCKCFTLLNSSCCQVQSHHLSENE